MSVPLTNTEEVPFHPGLIITVPDNVDHPHPDFPEILVIKSETVIGEEFPVDGIDLFAFDEAVMLKFMILSCRYAMMRLDTRPLVCRIPERRPDRGNGNADNCLMAGIIQFPLVHDDDDPVGILQRVRRHSGMPGEIEKKDVAFPEAGIGHSSVHHTSCGTGVR